VSGFNRRTRSIVVGLEAVEVDVPSEQLSQRSKAVLSEGGFSATSDEHITKFLEAIDMKKMTEEVAALGESLSKEPGTENISGRIIALLRPFFMMAVGSSKTSGRDPVVAFSLNDDHVTELNSAPDDAKAAQREGKNAVQEDIDLTRAHREANTPSAFYQILITAAYSYSRKVFNLGYSYVHRKDSSLSQFLGDSHTRAKRLAAMKIECSRPLAGTLAGAVLHTNDDRFKDQAALL
jgi:hypothetical protein